MSGLLGGLVFLLALVLVFGFIAGLCRVPTYLLTWIPGGPYGGTPEDDDDDDGDGGE